LADFVAGHSEDDVRVLILFKLIKTRVISALQTSHPYEKNRVDSQTLDQFCLDKAKRLAAIGKDPAEEDIRKLVAMMTQ
jgi:hypothetical protein